MQRYVSVIGPGDEAMPEDIQTAYSVGRLLAEHNIVVVNGGLRGVMEAASEGASKAGGAVIGLLPGYDRTEANEYLSIAIPTGIGEIRNGLVVRSADAIISIGGSWGTLSEIALAHRIGKPIICINGWHLTGSNWEEIDIARADTPEEAVNWILATLTIQ
jgi:uncharacterized protein (TIGR00725 family)